MVRTFCSLKIFQSMSLDCNNTAQVLLKLKSKRGDEEFHTHISTTPPTLDVNFCNRREAPLASAEKLDKKATITSLASRSLDAMSAIESTITISMALSSDDSDRCADRSSVICLKLPPSTTTTREYSLRRSVLADVHFVREF